MQQLISRFSSDRLCSCGAEHDDDVEEPYVGRVMHDESESIENSPKVMGVVFAETKPVLPSPKHQDDATVATSAEDIAIAIPGYELCRGLHVEVACATEQCLIVLKVLRGPVMRWNEANPSKQVLPYDRIISVNGSLSRPSDQIEELQRCGKKKAMKSGVALVLRRPCIQTIECSSSIGSDLGLELLAAGDSVLLITGIKQNGIVNDHNRANPDRSIRKGDSLLSVNGVAGSARDMQAATAGLTGTVVIAFGRHE